MFFPADPHTILPAVFPWKHLHRCALLQLPRAVGAYHHKGHNQQSQPLIYSAFPEFPPHWSSLCLPPSLLLSAWNRYKVFASDTRTVPAVWEHTSAAVPDGARTILPAEKHFLHLVFSGQAPAAPLSPVLSPELLLLLSHLLSTFSLSLSALWSMFCRRLSADTDRNSSMQYNRDK